MKNLYLHQIPQDHDNYWPVHDAELLAYRVAYQRSRDSLIANAPGQDYVVVARSEEALAFAVCDGVGQSFMGDVGAKWLGEALVKWLLETLPDITEGRASSELYKHLNGQIDKATAYIEEYVLSEDLDPELKLQLNDLRKFGSESMFFCGRVDLERSVQLFWLGDTVGQLWVNKTNEITGPFNTEDRWSSRQGVIGSSIHWHNHQLPDPANDVRLKVFTDGLGSIGPYVDVLPNEAVLELVKYEHNLPTSDDIAYLEVWANSPIPLPIIEHQLGPAPHIEKASPVGAIMLEWIPTPIKAAWTIIAVGTNNGVRSCQGIFC